MNNPLYSTETTDARQIDGILADPIGEPEPHEPAGMASPVTQAVLNNLPNPATDLDAGHVHIFNAQAASSKLNSNVDFWFNDRWRAYTVDEASKKITQDYAAQEKQKAENAKLWTAGEGGDAPQLDANGSQDIYAKMIDLVNSTPQRPGKAPLQDVNPAAAAVSGLFSIIDPTHAFDYAKAPLAAGLQSQAEQTQLDALRWQDRVAQIQATTGIMGHQAAQLAENERLTYNQRVGAFNNDLDRVFRSRATSYEAGQRWGQVVFAANAELQRMDIGQKLQVASQMVSVLNDPNQAPAIQARAAAFLEAVGIPLERLQTLTPQQRQAVLGNAMLDLQVKKAQELTPLEVDTAREQLGQLRIQGKYLGQELQAKIALIWAQYNQTMAAPGFEQQRLNLEGRRYDLEYGALGSARQANEAANKLSAELYKVRADMGTARDQAVEKLKKASWATPGEWFGDNRWLNKEEADSRNNQKVEAELAQSGEYQEMKKREGELAAQLAAARDAQQKMNQVAGKGGTNPVSAGDLGERYRAQGMHYSQSGARGTLDCSSFTQCVYKDAGVAIPRTAQEQFNFVQKLAKTDASVGDLIFFGSGPNSVKHVGMVVGFSANGTPLMRHMSSARDSVQDVDLDKYLDSVRKIGYQIQGIGRPRGNR